MRLSKATSPLRAAGAPATRTQGTGAAEDPQLAQALMQGIFDLGYGFAEQESLGWMEDALCAQTDPDIFYPEKGGSTAPATSICKNCSVRAECLEYAVTNDIRHGIWGGTSDNDRKRMSRERKAARGGGR